MIWIAHLQTTGQALRLGIVSVCLYSHSETRIHIKQKAHKVLKGTYGINHWPHLSGNSLDLCLLTTSWHCDIHEK